jgi:hypothetical protein
MLLLKSFLMLLMFFKLMMGSTFIGNFLQSSILVLNDGKTHIQNRGRVGGPGLTGTILLESKDF